MWVAFWVLLVLNTYLACKVYEGMFYMEPTPHWVVPIASEQAAEPVVVSPAEQITNETAEVQREAQRAAVLAEGTRYLNGKVLAAVIDLHQHNSLNPTLLSRFEPQITAPDTFAAESALTEAHSRENDPEQLKVLQGLRNDLDLITKYRADMQKKLNEADEKAALQPTQLEEDTPASTPEPQQEEPAPEPDPAPVDPTIPPDLTQSVPDQPAVPEFKPPMSPWERPLNISSKDGALIGAVNQQLQEYNDAVKQVSDLITSIVERQKRIADLKTQPVTPQKKYTGLVFVANTSKLAVNDQLFECKFGLLFCDYVGTVTGLRTQPIESQSPWSGGKMNGYAAEVEFTKPQAQHQPVLFIYEPL